MNEHDYDKLAKSIDDLSEKVGELNKLIDRSSKILPEEKPVEDKLNYIEYETSKVDLKRNDIPCKPCKRLHDLWKKASQSRWGTR